MGVSRRCFVKYCVGCVAVLGLDWSVLGNLEQALAGAGSKAPTYPITSRVFTTLDKTVVAAAPNPPDPPMRPCQLAQYPAYNYGVWHPDANGFPTGPRYPYIKPAMAVQNYTNPPPAPLSVRDPQAATLLTFFTMSDIHITDKESPAQVPYVGYQYPDPKTPGGAPIGNSSAYSGVILSTTHVLDAAVQTINFVHRLSPFDFGLSLGDAANNTQFNELRWFIDVLDGKLITPSSGAHLGAATIGYQKAYQAAGLDKSIPWYQVVGNHDQFWMGSYHAVKKVRQALVGAGVLNMGQPTTVPPDFQLVLSQTGYYQGVVDGSTPYGDIIFAGPEAQFPQPPQVAADPKRRSLTLSNWMRQFFHTTTQPVGHGFSDNNVQDGFACYSFSPKADIPIKFIVLDDTDKVEGNAAGCLDQQRYEWLVQELEDGQNAGELMVICAHIPIRPYANSLPTPEQPNPFFPLMPFWDAANTYNPTGSRDPEGALLNMLHGYPNLIAWLSGHAHRNTITPQPPPPGLGPEYGFWEIETPSLRDFPQQFRRLEIVRNSDNTISIFALDVDTAINPAAAGNGSASPAWNSRSYAIGASQIFNTLVGQGPYVDPNSGVLNAELVVHLTPDMQAKLAQLAPVISSFQINNGAASTTRRRVTLNNTVGGATPTHYMASEDPNFGRAAWQTYSRTPTYTFLNANPGVKTVYFKVKDGSGKTSAVTTAWIERVRLT